MKKINKLLKLVPIVTMVGATAPLVSLTSCGQTGTSELSVYTITYGSTPAGLTWGPKLSTVSKGESFTVTYALDPGYSLKQSSCVIKSGTTTITSSCTFTSTSLTIPADKITGNLTITLATQKDANSYTITYSTTPSGVTWTTQPKKVVENTGVSAEYTLDEENYIIDTTNSKITVGGTEIQNRITYDSGSINIPASLVTGNIVITLVTKPVVKYDVEYKLTSTSSSSDITWDSNPSEAVSGKVFSATYHLTSGKAIGTTNSTVTAGGTNITNNVSFTNGTVIVPPDKVTGDLVITLDIIDETDTHTTPTVTGGELKGKLDSTTGITTYTLSPTESNGEVSVTLTGTWLNAAFKIKAAGTYNITLNNCVISNGSKDVTTATEAPFDINKNATGAVVNLILPQYTESSINDRRTGSPSDDFVLRHNGVGTLNIQGPGALNINNFNNNQGAMTKGIQTKADVSITNGATVNVFAKDTAIQAGGKLTIDNSNVIADSYYDDAIKNKALDPADDVAGTSGTLNKNRDIIVKGKSTIKAYAARNGINAAHNFVSQSDSYGTPTIEVYTGYANAGSKVYNNDQLDEQNMYIAIPSDCFEYSDIEKYFFVIDFYDASEAVWSKNNEYMTLKKIRKDDAYYFFKCDRPLDANITKFKIKMYEKSAWGNESEETLYAESGEMTISNPTETNTTDCVTISDIDSDNKEITTAGSTFDCNYNELKDGDQPGPTPPGPHNGATIDTTIPSKGIKAKNEISLAAGNITLKTVDTCISAGYGEIFANSDTAGDVTFGTGNVTISGANVVGASTEGDGIKAYGIMNVLGGTTTISKSEEALEAAVINIKGGIIKLYAADDGMNASQTGKYNTSMLGINISGGVLDVQTTDTGDTDAIDSNKGISITGGLIITRVPGSGTAAALDCEDNSISMSGATLVCMGTVEPSISGPTQTTASSIYTSGNHTITYYISSSTTSTYTFNNNQKMNTTCKVYYNYKAPSFK